jgi:hypothetical protein
MQPITLTRLCSAWLRLEKPKQKQKIAPDLETKAAQQKNLYTRITAVKTKSLDETKTVIKETFRVGLAQLVRFLVLELTHPGLNPRCDMSVAFMANYSFTRR